MAKRFLALMRHVQSRQSVGIETHSSSSDLDPSRRAGKPACQAANDLFDCNRALAAQSALPYYRYPPVTRSQFELISDVAGFVALNFRHPEMPIGVRRAE